MFFKKVLNKVVSASLSFACRAQRSKEPQSPPANSLGPERKHIQVQWVREEEKMVPVHDGASSGGILRGADAQGLTHGHFLQGAATPHPQSVKKQQRERTHCWALRGE